MELVVCGSCGVWCAFMLPARALTDSLIHSLTHAITTLSPSPSHPHSRSPAQQPCSVGTFSLEGYSTCAECSEGSFSSVTSATACESCSAGKYNDRKGA